MQHANISLGDITMRNVTRDGTYIKPNEAKRLPANQPLFLQVFYSYDAEKREHYVQPVEAPAAVAFGTAAIIFMVVEASFILTCDIVIRKRLIPKAKRKKMSIWFS